MPSFSERSVMHIFGVTMMGIITLTIPMIQQINRPPSSSPPSLLFHPIENRKQVQGEEKKVTNQLQQQQDQKANFQDDYDVWDPTPRPGGAYASPVPHAKVRRYSTSLPKSYRG